MFLFKWNTQKYPFVNDKTPMIREVKEIKSPVSTTITWIIKYNNNPANNQLKRKNRMKYKFPENVRHLQSIYNSIIENYNSILFYLSEKRSVNINSKYYINPTQHLREFSRRVLSYLSVLINTDKHRKIGILADWKERNFA